jgi:nitrogen fixation NifU-like protein
MAVLFIDNVFFFHYIVNSENGFHFYYSQEIIMETKKPPSMRRMNDPTAAAWIKGLCGDTMEVYLTVKDGMIEEATFFTDGCEATMACGSAIAELAGGKSISEMLAVSPQHVIACVGDLPADHIHCAILAVSTLHKAVADYLLQY